MGADIRTEGHHAVVRGVPRLSGAPVRAPDIRAGVALVLAGLAAEGETVVSGAHHIGRGYQDLAGAPALARGQGDRPVSQPPPTDPAALLERARNGDRVALARLLSYIERGGDSATAVARLAYRSDIPYTVGLTGAPGAGKSTLTDGLIAQAPRRVARAPHRARVPGRGSRRRPDLPLQRGCHPRRPRAHEPACARPDRVHPVNGHPGSPGRPLSGRARRGSSARCGRRPNGDHRDRRRRADGGRDRVRRRHDRGGRDTRVG